MSDELRFLNLTDNETDRMLPTLALALLLLGSSVGVLYLSVYFAGIGMHFTLFGASIGLSAVAIFALVLRARFRSSEEVARNVFARMTLRDPAICALTDGNGLIHDVNAGFKAQIEAGAERDLAAGLGTLFENPREVIYRVLNDIQRIGFSEVQVADRAGAAWCISATECAQNNIIWRVAPGVLGNGEASQPMREVSFPVVHVDAEGMVVWANSAAREAHDEPTTLNDLIQEENGISYFLKPDARHPVQVLRNSVSAEVQEFAFVARDRDELHGPSPDNFLDALPVALARVDQDGKIAAANEGVRELLGEGAVIGARLEDLMEGLGRSISERVSDMFRGRSHMRSEVARAYKDGQEVYLQVTLKRISISGEASLVAVISDATELKTLEAQFVQSQKMQAVGQLAGGVAHDFNNLLTAISGHCDLLLMRHEQGDADHGDLIQVRQNANRAASLVGQLLAFSRKQTLLPKVLNLYDTLTELSHLLNRLLGEKVTLRIDHGTNLDTVRVDERQLEQVIMNLVVNARDAMPHGGEVRIVTRNEHFAEDHKRDRAVIPFGEYVRIDVRDTGHGIPPDKIKKIFEPFWTTKAPGEGTGLGLSTVYGIVKQTGGFIFANSEVGVGTCFTLYLPVHSDADVLKSNVIAKEPRKEVDLTGKGVVLLVEDELPVRSFAARALDIRGYTVIEAGCAEEALDILEDDELHVDVFVSDVIMPGMDGPTWVRKAREKRPDTRVVFVSGYAEDAFKSGEMEMENAAFLPKPFSLNDLTQTVKAQITA